MQEIWYVSGSSKGREGKLGVQTHSKAGRSGILPTKFAVAEHLCRSRADPVQTTVQIDRPGW